VLFPFGTAAPLSQKIATGVVSLIIGIAIGTLLTGVGARSTRPGAGPGSRPANPVEYPEIPGEYRTGRPYPADPREAATRPYRPQNRDQDR
jgi:hypothetical protein